MPTKHTVASFNHSCLKVPVNPASKLPIPSYERKLSSSSSNEVRSVRDKSKQRITSATSNGGWDSPKQCLQGNTENTGTIMATKTDLEGFLNFYESIPDYGDVNHLSDREFYIKVNYLREKQKSYMKILDENLVGSDITGTHKSKEKLQFAGNMFGEHSKNMNTNPATVPPNKCTDFCGTKKQVGKMTTDLVTNGYYSKTCGSSCTLRNSLSWEKKYSKSALTSPSPDISITSADNSNIVLSTNNARDNKNDSKLLRHSNNCTSDTEDTGAHMEMVKDKKTKIHSPSSALEKVRSRAGNKTRDIHSASTNKIGTEDSCSSTVDSMWDAGEPEYLASNSDSDDVTPLYHSLPSSPVFKSNKNVAWKEPKVTIPQPFKMTVRDEEEQHLNTLCGLLTAENHLLEDEQVNNSHGFKAHPVPLSTRLPLYDKIVAQQEERSRQVRQRCRLELQAQMKPFSFTKRNEAGRLHRLCRSTPELRAPDSPPPKPFRAKPVPRHLFNSYFYQRMSEDEFYRSLKKKIRAEEMLKASSLPPSMASRERIAKLRTRSLEMLAAGNSDDRSQRRQRSKELPAPESFCTKRRPPKKSAKYPSPDVTPTTSSSPYSEVYAAPDRLQPRTAIGLPLNRNNLAAVLRIQSSR